MRRRHPLAGTFPKGLIAAQGAAWRALSAPDARFPRALLARYAATAIAPRLAVRAAAAEAAPVEILLYDEIGYWGVDAKDFQAALARAGDGPIVLRINSPGGDVFDGYAIYNALKGRSAPVDVVIDGIAASAASFIAMAGRTISMAEPSMMMIHNAGGICFGDRRVMADMAAVLAKIDGQIAAIYAARANGAEAEFAAAMDAETWYTAAEAKAAGLCDATAADAAPGEGQAENVRRRRIAGRIAAAVEPYDPDGDGDNDALQALGSITTAMGHLSDAIGCLTGDGDDEEEDDPENPDMRLRTAPVTPPPSAADPPQTPAPPDAEAIAAHLKRMRARLRLAAAEAA